jgi:hypothetical protein
MSIAPYISVFVMIRHEAMFIRLVDSRALSNATRFTCNFAGVGSARSTMLAQPWLFPSQEHIKTAAHVVIIREEGTALVQV